MHFAFFLTVIPKHCVKNVLYSELFWFAFSPIRTEYGAPNTDTFHAVKVTEEKTNLLTKASPIVKNTDAIEKKILIPIYFIINRRYVCCTIQCCLMISDIHGRWYARVVWTPNNVSRNCIRNNMRLKCCFFTITCLVKILNRALMIQALHYKSYTWSLSYLC